MTRVQFFDFDGCLFDTAYECAVVAWCVRCGITERFQSVEVDRQFLRQFYVLKPYVRYAREYVVFCSDEYLSLHDQASLDAMLSSAGVRSQLESYQERFYRMRELIKAESFEAWLALNRPYPFALEALRCVAESAIIVSSKDSKTILELLAASQVTPRGVYDFSYASSKLGVLRRLRQELGVSLAGAVFLDDNVEHLLKAQESGVRPVLASWGYVAPEQRERADTMGIAVATAGNLRQILRISSPDP